MSESTRRYVQMFDSINRLPQIYKYYEHIHKSQMTESWNKSLDSDNPLPQSLSHFYDTIISVFHSQVCRLSVSSILI